MTKQELIDWKSLSTTIEVFKALQEIEALLVQSLTSTAGENPLEDRFKVGYIAALRDLYKISPEEVSE